MSAQPAIAKRADFTHVRYAQVWEDVDVLRAALTIRPGDRVFSIAAAGDNALALLLDDPAEVLAVDLNPAQTALVHLKIAALRHLDHEAMLRFLGVTAGADRLRTYADLRLALPVDVRQFWDAHLDAIASGVIHAGRFENYLRQFRRWILPVTQSRENVERILRATSIAGQHAVYDEHWNHPRWRGLFRVFFGKALLGRLGRDPAFFEHVRIDDIGAHFLERARAGVTQVPVETNYYLEYILTGRYSGRHGLPPYLDRTSADIIRARLDRLVVRTESLETALASRERSFDAFNLSDCFEWMDDDATTAVLERIDRSARPDARVCYWNLLVERSRPESLKHRLAPDVQLANALHEKDRTFFYRALRVEHVIGA